MQLSCTCAELGTLAVNLIPMPMRWTLQWWAEVVSWRTRNDEWMYWIAVTASGWWRASDDLGSSTLQQTVLHTRAWSRVAGRRASDNIWLVLVTAISIRGEQRVTVGFAETEITVDNWCFRQQKNISFSKRYSYPCIVTRQLGCGWCINVHRGTSLRMMRVWCTGIGWCQMAPGRCCSHSPLVNGFIILFDCHIPKYFSHLEQSPAVHWAVHCRIHSYNRYKRWIGYFVYDLLLYVSCKNVNEFVLNRTAQVLGGSFWLLQ